MSVRLVSLVCLTLACPLLVATGVDARQADQSPPGRIAFVRSGNIWAWTAEGEAEVVRDDNASDPRWSPDGGEILYVQRGGSFSDLVLYDFSGGTAIRLTDSESAAEPGSPDYVATSAWVMDPSWSASETIAYISDAGTDAETGDMRLWLLPSWDAAPSLAPSDGSDAGDLEDAGLDASGTVAVYTVLAFGGPGGATTYVAIRDLTSGATFTLAEGPHGAYDPAISPDGQAIVVSIRDEQRVSDLWLIDRATGEQTRLTQGAQAAAAAWSPDGEWIAYIRPNGTTFEVWALAIDRATGTASGEPQRLFGHADLDATSGLSWTFSQLNIP